MKNHYLYTSSHHPYIGGPPTCYQRSHFFNFLCNDIIHNSYILGEHFLKIDTLDNSWRLKFDSTIILLKQNQHITVELHTQTPSPKLPRLLTICTLNTSIMHITTVPLDGFQCDKWIAVRDIFLNFTLKDYDTYFFNDLYIVANSGNDDGVFCVYRP